jgi:hypothetical protein
VLHYQPNLALCGTRPQKDDHLRLKVKPIFFLGHLPPPPFFSF